MKLLILGFILILGLLIVLTFGAYALAIYYLMAGDGARVWGPLGPALAGTVGLWMFILKLERST